MSGYKQFLEKKSPDELDEFRMNRRTYDKDYREANKERLKEKLAIRLKSRPCEICGKQYSLHNSTRHLQSKTHRRALGEDIPDNKKGPRHQNATSNT